MAAAGGDGLKARLGRWVRQSGLGLAIGARLGSFYIWFALRTTRWTEVGRENTDGVLSRGTGMIAAIWHGRLFYSPTWGEKGRRTVAMISANRDGELIARIVHRWNVETVRGSSYDRRKRRDKGGKQAFAEGLKAIREHAVLAVSPDGPRGPRMRLQPGVAQLSIASGLPVVPVAFSVRRGKVLRSWDRFLVPFPFTKGVKIYGKPLEPPADPTLEEADEYRLRIEAALTEVTNRADDLCGRPYTEPGPPLEISPVANGAEDEAEDGPDDESEDELQEDRAPGMSGARE